MKQLTRLYKESFNEAEDKSSLIPHYLYFVYVENNEAVKIGITNCIYNRMQHYKTSNPCDVILIADLTLPNKEVAERLEEKIHCLFKKYRLHGEWFLANNEVLSFAKDIRNLESKIKKFYQKDSIARKEKYFKKCIKDIQK